jgi:GDPmannose 4,6-dehydratase
MIGICGDPTKVEKVLGWKAKTDWKALVKLMVEADLEKVKSQSK